ncbi:MAG TPA: acetamidase/formamidase family protein [Geminicoccus sp.]|uniref:acetamidase/formamidase family protein n=1 Tax=Geminicoccus sp. TaxID=2024832 RepID=UPI002E364CC2|nr:acetamidase/formamidase family protein [Geminicoccus sp.]HEX2526643.1 acetamidase/formamidase family protein [Geminicoccus sp.]
MATHYIERRHHHFGWDNSLSPVLTVQPGDIVEFETIDASGGQLTPNSTAADVATLDFGKVNPATGPILVEGAEPGDALVVHVHDMKPSGWGWTANIPGFGLLAHRFTQPALVHWHYDTTLTTPAPFKAGASVPLKPFIGVIGQALAESGLHSVVPPRRVGGNMDTADICVGSTVTFPVEVEGALFSLGDTHAAQGDGEVCGTAIESAMNVVVELQLIKNRTLKFPIIDNPSPRGRHIDGKGYLVTTGIGPDLMQNAIEALDQMVDLISDRLKIEPVDAYMLCSACADLKITEIVDQPNWIVGCHFPKAVLP